MKKILLVALVAFTMFSCNQGIMVSFDDPKSQAILSVYDSYMQNDAAAIESLYAEDAVVYLNSLDSIPIQENVKNLGVTMDKHFTFENHIENIYGKAKGILYFLNKNKYDFDETSRKLVVEALVMSIVSYCSIYGMEQHMSIYKKFSKFKILPLR